jgi:hypothetical protein
MGRKEVNKSNKSKINNKNKTILSFRILFALFMFDQKMFESLFTFQAVKKPPSGFLE